MILLVNYLFYMQINPLTGWKRMFSSKDMNLFPICFENSYLSVPCCSTNWRPRFEYFLFFFSYYYSFFYVPSLNFFYFFLRKRMILFLFFDLFETIFFSYKKKTFKKKEEFLRIVKCCLHWFFMSISMFDVCHDLEDN